MKLIRSPKKSFNYAESLAFVEDMANKVLKGSTIKNPESPKQIKLVLRLVRKSPSS